MNPSRESRKFDAILVAGEGESSFKVYHQHKAFVKIEGKCLIHYVIEALQRVETVRRIYIVGLKDKLNAMLEEAGIDTGFPKPIFVVEQLDNLYENIWNTFLKTLPHEGDLPDLENSSYRERAVLIVPCDSPLITPHEIEYFLLQCDTRNHDHILGLVAEENLRHFYPRGGLPGIRMNYLHLKEKVCRINNLHLVKPLMMRNRHYIKEMYQFRYQRKFKNVIPFMLKLIGKDKFERIRYYIGLQLCLWFSGMGLDSLVRYFRTWVPKTELEQCLSNVMETRFMGLEVPFPGAVLDIDNDRDYETIKLRFKEWREYLIRLNQKYPLPYGSEYTV